MCPAYMKSAASLLTSSLQGIPRHYAELTYSLVSKQPSILDRIDFYISLRLQPSRYFRIRHISPPHLPCLLH